MAKRYTDIMRELWNEYPRDVEMSFDDWVKHKMEEGKHDEPSGHGRVENEAL
jgi:hypothetical protein